MKDQLQHIFTQVEKEAAMVTDAASLEKLKIKYLGRKTGLLTIALKELKNVSVEEKREIGPFAHEMKKKIEQIFENKNNTQQKKSVIQEDITLPGIEPSVGYLHPLTRMIQEITAIFRSMGFVMTEGPELDSDYYNFEGLNFPPGHPARDTQDTFFIKTPMNRKDPHHSTQWLMRTQTSNMQVHIMEENEPPLRYIVPGRVFRNEATDATHEHTFYQLEGFVVDKNVTIGQLVWTLKEVFRNIYGNSADVRLRPGYFPFVEPGYEIDIYTPNHGWLEMAGAGMIHPKVFEAAGYKPGAYTGFAFGIGLMRVAMLAYNVEDIRSWMQNDIRFLQQ